MPLWNLYFACDPITPKAQKSHIRDWFADVEGHLFYATVARPLGILCLPAPT